MPTGTAPVIGVEQAQPKQDSLSDKLLVIEEAEVGLMLSDLMKALEAVNLNDPKAKLNETSISDNNGGRIRL